jgi:hypothetical protein
MNRMLHDARPGPLRCLQVAALLLAVSAFPACADLSHTGAEEEPFYYYGNQRISLVVDDSRLTVALAPTTETDRIAEVLASRGVPVDSVAPLPMEGHYLVHLPAGRTARAMEDFARALRLAAGIEFASAVYVEKKGGCALQLVNRLAVQFSTSTSAAQIAALNTETGVRNEEVRLGGTRAYAYPAAMFETPLQLAAHYHQQSFVDWAEADRYSCFHRS